MVVQCILEGIAASGHLMFLACRFAIRLGLRVHVYVSYVVVPYALLAVFQETQILYEMDLFGW